jgi:sec-independent protein translocase protein TatA
MTSSIVLPLIAGIGPPEIILILLVLVLLFGATKLPELARGSGRALRIFKAETKGLMDDDEDQPASTKTPEQLELEARQEDLAKRQADLEAEAERLRRGETS